MNISLNPEQEQFVESQIAKGKYANIQQVIDSALKLLEKEEESYQKWFDETRQKIVVGLKQLELGEKVDGEVVMAQFEEKFKQMRMEKLGEEI